MEKGRNMCRKRSVWQVTNRKQREETKVFESPLLVQYCWYEKTNQSEQTREGCVIGKGIGKWNRYKKCVMFSFCFKLTFASKRSRPWDLRRTTRSAGLARHLLRQKWWMLIAVMSCRPWNCFSWKLEFSLQNLRQIAYKLLRNKYSEVKLIISQVNDFVWEDKTLRAGKGRRALLSVTMRLVHVNMCILSVSSGKRRKGMLCLCCGAMFVACLFDVHVWWNPFGWSRNVQFFKIKKNRNLYYNLAWFFFSFLNI